MNTLLKEFREFAMKGNAIDMAVGLIVGVGFGDVIKSLVNDVIMPPFSALLGNINFSNLFIDLSGQNYVTLADAEAAGVPVLKYGVFLNTLLEFVIIAFVVFLVIRQANKIRKVAPKPAA